MRKPRRGLQRLRSEDVVKSKKSTGEQQGPDRVDRIQAVAVVQLLINDQHMDAISIQESYKQQVKQEL